MPIYIYKHPKEDNYTEVLQTMAEDHVYFDSDGLEWKRVFTVPYASIDSQIDPSNKRQFLQATESKKGSVGDMMDLSRELSERRTDSNGGIDPIKEKYFSDYSKKRNGAKHFDQIRQKGHDGKHVKMDFND